MPIAARAPASWLEEMHKGNPTWRGQPNYAVLVNQHKILGNPTRIKAAVFGFCPSGGVGLCNLDKIKKKTAVFFRMSSLTYQRGEYFLLMRTLSGGHTRPARPTDHLCASRKPGSGEAHSNSSPLDWGKPCAWKPHTHEDFFSGLFWELRRFSIPTAALAPHSIPKRLIDSHDQQ